MFQRGIVRVVDDVCETCLRSLERLWPEVVLLFLHGRQNWHLPLYHWRYVVVRVLGVFRIVGILAGPSCRGWLALHQVEARGRPREHLGTLAQTHWPHALRGRRRGLGVCVDVAHLELLLQRRRQLGLVGEGACEAVARCGRLRGLRGGAGHAVELGRPGGDIGVVLYAQALALALQAVHVGHAVRLLAARDLQRRLLALVAAMANDVGLRAGKVDRQPPLARARPQTTGAGALAVRCSAAEDLLGARPPLGAGDVDAGLLRGQKGGGGLLLGIRLVGRGLEEVVDVVVELERVGSRRLGLLLGAGVVFGEVLPPAAALAQQLVAGLSSLLEACVDHHAPTRTLAQRLYLWGRRVQ